MGISVLPATESYMITGSSGESNSGLAHARSNQLSIEVYAKRLQVMEAKNIGKLQCMTAEETHARIRAHAHYYSFILLYNLKKPSVKTPESCDQR